jgi:hypothetical protein
MTSRTEARIAFPAWGAEVERRPARATEAGGGVAGRPLRLDAPRRGGSEVVAAVVLAVLWIALWALFTAGVVEPGAALHAAATAAQAPVERAP